MWPKSGVTGQMQGEARCGGVEVEPGSSARELDGAFSPRTFAFPVFPPRSRVPTIHSGYEKRSRQPTTLLCATDGVPAQPAGPAGSITGRGLSS